MKDHVDRMGGNRWSKMAQNYKPTGWKLKSGRCWKEDFGAGTHIKMPKLQRQEDFSGK
jgi:hypothetical protein